MTRQPQASLASAHSIHARALTTTALSSSLTSTPARCVLSRRARARAAHPARRRRVVRARASDDADADADADAAKTKTTADGEPDAMAMGKGKRAGGQVNLFDPAASASRFITRRFGFGGALVFIGLLASVEGGEIVKAVLEDVTEKTGTGEEVVTESGLKYVDLKIGGGKSATKGDFVGIQLKLSDANDPSKVFVDTTAKGGRKIAFVYQRRPLLSPVFPGLEEAVSGMKRGGTRRFTAPPELGYGSEKVMLPDGTVVPGGTTLAVEVSLEEVSAMYV